MNLFIDFILLIIFFICYKYSNIYFASVILMITTAISLLINWFKTKKLDNLSLINFFLLLICGLLTIHYHNLNFIKWKVTIIYLFFSVVMFYSSFFLKKSFVKIMMNEKICLESRIWKNLDIFWCIFFLLCGIMNIYIAYYFSQNTWITFKVFGLLTLTLLFALINVIYIYKNKNLSNK